MTPIERDDIAIQANSRAGDAFPGAIPNSHTVPRWALSNQAVPSASGALYLSGGASVVAGRKVTGIRGLSGTTAAATSTHCQFVVCYADLIVAAATIDDTAASPWAANTLKELDFLTPWVPPASGAIWLGVLSIATTVPTMKAVNTAASTEPGVPKIGGISTTGLAAALAVGTLLTTPTGSNVIAYMELV